MLKYEIQKRVKFNCNFNHVQLVVENADQWYWKETL